MLGSKIKVALKYCGSCNPLIDLSKIGNELKEVIGKEDDLILVAPESNHIDTMVILCGCPRACGNKQENRAKANRSIVVAAETIDMVPVAEKDISTAVMEKLKSLTDSVK
ncbi:MAG: hypothetical protein ACE5KP_01200 [Dehalococcoidales bacterium]